MFWHRFIAFIAFLGGVGIMFVSVVLFAKLVLWVKKKWG